MPRDARSTPWIADLYDRHGAALYRYAVMLLADPAGAADAVQQVFVASLRRRSPPESAAAYLRRAVRNECYSMLRRRLREPIVDAAEPLLELVAGAAGSPDERIALEQAIARLPPEQREVVHLHAFEGLTFQEIADVTRESINTVASRYRYALDKLRAQLGARI
jgi:RNA polymerase sigma-70 factor (ECF subfamily)